MPAACAEELVLTDNRNEGPRSWPSLVLRDPQFWVPVVVLAAGLAVLRWIS
ncbi:MAG TPA: hypothetical protein VLJ83_08730 [Gemmatimonadaceae bacterium]|nr:hypothetical protein [Gemmatimonadaceae bacterium]